MVIAIETLSAPLPLEEIHKNPNSPLRVDMAMLMIPRGDVITRSVLFTEWVDYLKRNGEEGTDYYNTVKRSARNSSKNAKKVMGFAPKNIMQAYHHTEDVRIKRTLCRAWLYLHPELEFALQYNLVQKMANELALKIK